MPAGAFPSRRPRQTPAERRAGRQTASAAWPSLDFGFLVLDVLLGDRIIFLLRQLVGLGARVLAGHVIVAGAGARHELDLQTDGFGHGFSFTTERGRR